MVLAASGDFFGRLHDFFDSGSWPLVQNLLIFFVIVFWLAVGYWVYKDARRRIEDPWLVGAATVLGLVPPFVGAFIYMLFRPPEYLEDVRERELEIKAMEESLGHGGAALPGVPRGHRPELPRLPGLHDDACGRPASRASSRWSRSGRSARTARHRSSRRRRFTSRRSKLHGPSPGPSSIRRRWRLSARSS